MRKGRKELMKEGRREGRKVKGSEGAGGRKKQTMTKKNTTFSNGETTIS